MMHDRPYSPVRAGLAYGTLLFGAGFVLGTLRTLWLADALGATRATLFELPVMLAFAWWLSGRILARMALRCSALDRLAMGAIGLLVLLLLEWLIVLPLRGEGIAHYLDGFFESERLIGFAGQLLAAAFPLVRGQANSSASSA